MSGGPVIDVKTGSLVGIVAGATFDPATGLVTSYKVLDIQVVAKDFEIRSLLDIERNNSTTLKLVDLYVDDDKTPVGKPSIVDVKLRNIGNETAFVHRLEIWVEKIWKLRTNANFHMTNSSATYDVRLSGRKPPYKVILHKLSHSIGPQQTDRFEISLSNGEGGFPGSFFLCRFVVVFNEDKQRTVSQPILFFLTAPVEVNGMFLPGGKSSLRVRKWNWDVSGQVGQVKNAQFSARTQSNVTSIDQLPENLSRQLNGLLNDPKLVDKQAFEYFETAGIFGRWAALSLGKLRDLSVNHASDAVQRAATHAIKAIEADRSLKVSEAQYAPMSIKAWSAVPDTGKRLELNISDIFVKSSRN